MSKKTKRLKKRVSELQSMLDIVCNEPDTEKGAATIMAWKLRRKLETQIMYGNA